MFHRIAISLLVVSTGVCSGQTGRFESRTELHRILRKAIPGTIVFDEGSVEFRSPKLSHRWAFGDIKTFTLSGSKTLGISDYDQTFSFTLARPIPPELAARLTEGVGRPVVNGDPIPKLPSFAEIPAHRRKVIGGSNGVLRFREDGIDYVAQDGQDGRSWRWSDIQTIGKADPWQFRVTAYREIVEFDLKQPMLRELFDRLWDKLYASDLNLRPGGHQ